MKKYKSNPFTLSFGKEPLEYISRAKDKEQLIDDIKKYPPLSNYYIITGIRGSGKTVMLTNIASYFENESDYIVVELNPEDDLRESLAAKLYAEAHVKHLFLEKNFSFSFSGLTFSISGKNPVLHIDDLLDKMLKELHRQNKKVIVLIDEVTKTPQLKQFALSSQILIRKGYDLFVIMTGLFENISSIENEANLTFLIRAPRIYLSSLNISSIVHSYCEILNLTYEKALEMAKITKGYAFAFQLLGYLLFEKQAKELSREILGEFDQYLEEYVYNKVWSSLSEMEQTILANFKTNEIVKVKDIISKLNITKEYFSRYRDKLIKKGIIISPAWGQLTFALPRFKEYIDTRL